MEQAVVVKKWQWSEKRFNIRDYLLEQQIIAEENQTVEGKRTEVDTMFNRLKRAIIEHFQERFENGREHEKMTWLTRQHEAITGVKTSVDWFKREIEEFLRKNNLLASSYPHCYSDIVEAAYQETYGLGPISTWWKHEHYENSQAARIIGTNIFFEIPGQLEELQEISYQSEADVLRVAKQLSLRNPTTSLNAHKPSLQIDMADGTRVTIIIPPWATRPTIIFRHYTVKRVTLEDISDFQTFPREVVQILRTISRGRGTTVLSGPVKSGKSTLLSAMIAERKTYDKMIIVQKDFDELKTSTYYPKHEVMEFIIDKNNMQEVFDLILRSDYEYMIVGELRSQEIEIFLKGAERGLPGAMTTYHTPDPEDIPSQMADLVIENQPGKDRRSQYERVAKNIHFAAVMEERKDRSKRLVKLVVFDWNPETREFKTHDLVVWDRKTDTWRYNNYIPDRVYNILDNYAPTETENMMKLLDRLTEANPIKKG
ncbi:pilus assembly protein CpaF [Paenibacillus mucilaginosus]|uniref:ATPase, T2SS/T4P/T4SS family n=1 Tax=Paenibacillus mucilaginosus TaxID=61624 RepID=UPI003D1A9FFF